MTISETIARLRADIAEDPIAGLVTVMTDDLLDVLDAIEGGEWEQRVARTPMNVVHSAMLSIEPEMEHRFCGPWKEQP